MGNNQSQESDHEEEPEYNYHERVLLEAQKGVSNRSINPSECISEDEQYHSAEEGDSVRSITPPRTRPESSSEGESAEETHDSEIEADEQDTENDGNTSEAGEFVVPASPNVSSPKGNLRSKKSCGQCNVSVFQEHDSIGPEIAVSRVHSDNSLVGSANSTRQSQSLVSGGRSIISNPSTDTPPSPFIPISSPPGSQHISFKKKNHEESTGGKRKLEPSTCESVEEIPPAPKKTATRDNVKRKRLGYFESSESEETDQERSVTPAKRGRFDSKSPKKQRRTDRSSRNRNDSVSDSDEKRYRKNRRTRRSGHSESDSEESVDDTDRRRRSRKRSRKSKNSPRRGRRKSSDYSSEERYETRKRRRSERQRSQESDSEEEYDHRKSSRGRKNKNTVRKDTGRDSSLENQRSLSSEQFTQTEMAQSELKAEKNNIITSDEHIASNQPCHTLKMGNQAVRNVHGKVLPLRHQDEQNFTNLATETTQNDITVNQTKSNISSLKNIMDNLRPRNSAFIVASSLHLKRKETGGLEQNIKDNVNNSNSSLVHENSLTKSQHEKDCTDDSDSDLEENVSSSASPFKGIVLTPSRTNTNSLAVHQTHGVYRGEKTGRNDSDMEVDTVTMELQTDTVKYSTSQVPNREILKARSRGRSATERLKNFWSEKKQTIGSNLKSLFSKSTFKSPNSSGRSWQSFLSSPASVKSASSTPQSQTAHPMLTSSPQSNPPPLRVLRSRSVTPVPSQSLGSKISPVLAMNQSVGSRSISLAAGQSPGQTQNKTFGNGGRQGQAHSLKAATNTGKANHDKTAVEFLPRTSSFQVLHFRLLNLVNVSVSMEDIANQPTGGIVNWTDGALMHNVTDCSRSIAAKAGALMRAACNDFIENKGGPLQAPDVLTTPAGGHFERSVEAILHVVVPEYIEGREDINQHGLMEVYANSFRFANERLGLSSTSFPVIGEGIFPMDMCIQTFFDALLIFLAENSLPTGPSTDLTDIRLVISDANVTDFAAALISSSLDRITSDGLDSVMAETVSQYLGHQNESDQGINNTESANSVSSPGANSVNKERTLSGRPRMKRPRL